MGRPGQIPLALPVRSAWDRDSFQVSEANEAALALVDRWPDWTAPWALVSGPAGAGKSHLAHIWAARVRAAQGGTVRVIDGRDLTVEQVPDLLHDTDLALELGEPPVCDEPALFHLINLTKEWGRSLLVTARSHPGDWPLERADLTSRLRAMPCAAVTAPGDAMLEALLVKLFRDRQVVVKPQVIKTLTLRMERSFDAALALVDELDRLALARRGPITARMALEVVGEHAEDLEDHGDPADDIAAPRA